MWVLPPITTVSDSLWSLIKESNAFQLQKKITFYEESVDENCKLIARKKNGTF